MQGPAWFLIMTFCAEAFQLAQVPDAGGLPVGSGALAERIRELTDFQHEALNGFYTNISDSMLLSSDDGCPRKPFTMFMPAHTATVTTLQVLVASLKNMGIGCGRSAGQGHEHNKLANDTIRRESWENFHSTISFVMAKDPWSRVRSAAAWLRGVGINDSMTDEENIADFRKHVADWTRQGNGRGWFTYLHSITDYSHAIPPGKTHKQQVVTYVGRVATLGKSVRHVCGLLGIPAGKCVDPDSVNSHRITTVAGKRRPRTEDFYDDETRGIVARLWEEDIKNFGFKFGEM